MEESQERFRMSDGFELFYRHWRPVGEVKRVVLCMHGIEAHSGAFRFLGDELAAEQTEVYAIDRRGFGNSREKSPSKGDTKDFNRHLQDVNEAVRYIHKNHPGKKLFMLGHSLGTFYTLSYVANHPNLLDGIILAAPPVDSGVKLPTGDTLKFPFLLLFRPRTLYDFVDKWPRAFRESEEYRLLTADPLCTKEFGVRWLVSVQRTLANKALECASRIEEPTLVIQGEQDIIALPSGARKLMERVTARDKSLRTLPDADHWFYHAIIPNIGSKYALEQRRQVSDTIRSWLEAH